MATFVPLDYIVPPSGKPANTAANSQTIVRLRQLLVGADDWYTRNIRPGINEGEALQLIRDYAEVKCNHENTVLVRQIDAGGNTKYFRSCGDCGRKISQYLKSASIPPAELKKAIPYVPPDWQEESRMRNAIIDHLTTKFKGSKSSQWWQEYNRFLQSPKWHEIRLKVFTRENWLCQGCREKRAAEVHHLTYEHAFDPFLFELVALCHECHDKLTKEKSSR